MASYSGTVDDWLSNGESDATWVLGSAFMILTMQSGFGLLEAGSLPAKFGINILMKNAIDVLLGGLSFWMVGHGFSKGESWHGILGTTKFFTDQSSDLDQLSREPMETFSEYIFEFAFAATATTIVSGSVAGRMKFHAYMVFSFFNTICYSFPAHWVFSDQGWLNQQRFVDFAGDGPVHLLGGMNALVAAWMVGPRAAWIDGSEDYRPEDLNPSNQIQGLFMLWWGWIGFNCGSTFGTTEFKWLVACRVGVTTLNASIGGGLYGVAVSLIRNRQVGIVVLVEDVVNGTLSGLVAITGPCAATHPATSFFIGAGGAVFSHICNYLLSHYRIVDDPVGAVGVHGAAAAWGLLSTGLFADSALVSGPSKDGFLYGGGFELLGIQMIGTLSCAFWGILSAAVLLILLQWTIGLRASSEEISGGFDWSEHRVPISGQSAEKIFSDESLQDQIAELRDKLERVSAAKSAEAVRCQHLEAQVVELRERLEEISTVVVAMQRREAALASSHMSSTLLSRGSTKQETRDEKIESRIAGAEGMGAVPNGSADLVAAADAHGASTIDTYKLLDLMQIQLEEARRILRERSGSPA